MRDDNYINMLIYMICGLFLKFFYFPKNNLLLTQNRVFVKKVSEKIQIMSYNVRAFFPFYNFKRIDNILTFIEEQFSKNQIDVLCLQEAYEFHFLDHLYDIATKYGLYVAHPSLEKKYMIGENSGLIVLSRFPTKLDSVFVYPISSGLDQFAKKSAMYFSFYVNDKRYKVMTTHLQSDNDLFAIKQIEMAIYNAPVIWDNSFIIIGDLNIDFCQDNIVTFPDTKKQYDYISFYNQPQPDSKISVYNTVNFSDHYPIKIIL